MISAKELRARTSQFTTQRIQREAGECLKLLEEMVKDAAANNKTEISTKVGYSKPAMDIVVKTLTELDYNVATTSGISSSISVTISWKEDGESN